MNFNSVGNIIKINVQKCTFVNLIFYQKVYSKKVKSILMATKREKYEKSFLLSSTDTIHPFCINFNFNHYIYLNKYNY